MQPSSYASGEVPEKRERYKGPAVESMTPEQKRIYDEISRTRTTGVAGPFAPWLANPAVADHAQNLGRTVRYGLAQFGLKESEMVILTVAAGTESRAEWEIHEGEALKAGVGERLIEAIAGTWGGGRVVDRNVFGEGESAEREWAIYSFAEECCRRRTVGEETYWRARELVGDAGLSELVALVGYYNLVSMTLNVFEIEAPKKKEGGENGK